MSFAAGDRKLLEARESRLLGFRWPVPQLERLVRPATIVRDQYQLASRTRRRTRYVLAVNDRTTRLLRNGLDGDADDYSAFVGRVTPLMITVAQRCGAALARRGISPEDIAQDVWLQCLPKLGTLTPHEGRMTPVVVKYLSTAVRRRVRDLLLAAANRTMVAPSSQLGEVANETVGIVTRMVAAEQSGAVLAAIAELDPGDRDALTLLSIEQVTLAEASEMLGISKDAAKQRHHRARERLRAQLPDSVFDELD